MKKFISIALLLALCLSLFAGCNGNQPEPVNPLESAKTYLFNIYNTAGKDEANKLTADKDVTSVVVYDGVSFQVEWTVEITSGPAEGVKISESSKANHVKIDIMDNPEEDIVYTLTATIKDTEGKTASVSFKYFTPAVKKVEVSGEGKVVLYFPEGEQYITDVDYLYTSSNGSQKHELELTKNESEAVVLTSKKNDDGTVSLVTDDGRYLMCDGKHVQFVTEQGEHTKFVLETSTMEGVENGVFIKCANATYNDKAQYLEVYSGYLTCYGMDDKKVGIYTFVLKESTSVPASAILDAAYALGKDEALAGGPYTLTGVISKIDTAWSDTYQNITVTIVCGGDTARPMMCYRLAGDGAKELAVGDTITVTGNIKNYGGTVEFDKGCTLDKVVKAEGSEGGSDKEDNTDNKDDNTDNKEETKPSGSASPLNGEKPVAGTGYKFAMLQGSKNVTLYFAGKMDGYYLATTENAAEATEVFVEEVDGGLRMYFMDGAAKKYIDIIPREGAEGKVNVTITETPSAVYTWNDTLKVLVAKVVEKNWYLGTYGTFSTFSASETFRIEDASVVGVSQFVGEFVK